MRNFNFTILDIFINSNIPDNKPSSTSLFQPSYHRHEVARQCPTIFVGEIKAHSRLDDQLHAMLVELLKICRSRS